MQIDSSVDEASLLVTRRGIHLCVHGEKQAQKPVTGPFPKHQILTSTFSFFFVQLVLDAASSSLVFKSEIWSTELL